MTMVGLPMILFQVGEEITFFFNKDGTPAYEGDELNYDFDNSLATVSTTTISTLQYPGNQPLDTPRSGNIQASGSLSGMIVSNIEITKPAGNAIYNIFVIASNVANDDTGAQLFSGTLDGTSLSTGVLLLPQDKFLTVKATYVSGDIVILNTTTSNLMQRGVDTHEIDPVLH